MEHDFFGFHGRGGEAANARQRLPSATHEVNTQTPCTQGNMRGVVAVFDVSFVWTHRLCDEFALRMNWLGHLFRPVCGFDKNKFQDFSHTQWVVWGASIDQNQACTARKALIWTWNMSYSRHTQPLSAVENTPNKNHCFHRQNLLYRARTYRAQKYL